MKEPEKKEEDKKQERTQVKARDKAILEIKVYKLINHHKRVIKTVKELLLNKVNLKVKSVKVKKAKLFQRNNQVRNSQAKKDRIKIWEKLT